MIAISIDVTRITKSRIKEKPKGKFLDLVLFENRDGTDQYGQDGYVCESVTKEEREKGVKGNILGNWKYLKKKTESRPPAKPAAPASSDEDVPF